MSNISRRDFLKTAGVMTLAVAAAGVLAGCEGNVENPEVPSEVTKESVTVGNYTFSIQNVKHYAAKSYDKDGKATVNGEYVVALFNLKKIDESKKDDIKLTLNLKPVNMVETKYVASTKGEYVPMANIQKVLDVKENLVAFPTTTISGYANPSSTGLWYAAAFKVDQYADKVWKTPTLDVLVNDEAGRVYAKLTASIPTAEEVAYSKLVSVKA